MSELSGVTGKRIVITPELREKVNGYLGAEVLTKRDEGRYLVDQSARGRESLSVKVAGIRNVEQASRLNAAGDGVIGIEYDGKASGLEKLIDVRGRVTTFFCSAVIDDVARYCAKSQAHELAYATVDPEKATLLTAAVFGLDALPDYAWAHIMTPQALESALAYFDGFEATDTPTTESTSAVPPPAAPLRFGEPVGEGGPSDWPGPD